MVTLNLSEQQVNTMFGLLDLALRSNGTGALALVVDLHNTLTSAVQASQSAAQPAGVSQDSADTQEAPPADLAGA